MLYKTFRKYYYFLKYLKGAYYDIKLINKKYNRIKKTISTNISNRILVSTKRGLYILNKKSIIKVLAGEYFGITCSDDSVYAFEKVDKSTGRLLKLNFDKNYNLSSFKVIFNNLSSGVHQIRLFGDYLFLADTYNNRIIKVSTTNSTRSNFYPLGKLDKGRKSANYGHINSISFHNNHIYLMCHNETSKTGRFSEIVKLDHNFNILSIIKTNSTNAHDIVFYKNDILHCDSMSKNLIKNDTVVFESDFFTRGILLDNDFIFLGGSEYAKRGNRNKVSGYMQILDKNFNEVDSFTMPGMVQDMTKLS